MTENKFSTGRKIYISVLFVLLVLTIGFIWCNSMLDGNTSSKESDRVFVFLEPFFDFVFGKGVITEAITRKMAHVTEFFILGLELTLIFVAYGNYNFKNWLFIISEGVFIALFDETIQYFTRRGSSVIDVLIDGIGVMAVSLFAGLISIIVCSVKNKKATKKK